MGIYINPRESSKEDWLRANGKIIFDEKRGLSIAPSSFVSGDNVAVCLVDNGGFTAAAVAFSPEELSAFASPEDFRPKVWFWVPFDKLSEVIGHDLREYIGAVNVE